MEYTARPFELDQATFLRRVFAWMCGGLATTGLVAWSLSASGDVTRYFADHTALFFGTVIVELLLVFALVGLVRRLSPAVAGLMFFVYSALSGVTFALIFEIYTSESIFATFLVTAGMFGALAFYGYTTKRDLASMGSILFMALIGLIIASVVNILWANSVLYWITTFAGVIIFAGLTAYDMQKIKEIGAAPSDSADEEAKEAIIGALSLYLDFVNLFLYLLRLFGRRR